MSTSRAWSAIPWYFRWYILLMVGYLATRITITEIEDLLHPWPSWTLFTRYGGILFALPILIGFLLLINMEVRALLRKNSQNTGSQPKP